jgi:hypothetical protein
MALERVRSARMAGKSGRRGDRMNTGNGPTGNLDKAFLEDLAVP